MLANVRYANYLLNPSTSLVAFVRVADSSQLLASTRGFARTRVVLFFPKRNCGNRSESPSVFIIAFLALVACSERTV